jgi:hypothetical protein
MSLVIKLKAGFERYILGRTTTQNSKRHYDFRGYRLITYNRYQRMPERWFDTHAILVW